MENNTFIFFEVVPTSEKNLIKSKFSNNIFNNGIALSDDRYIKPLFHCCVFITIASAITNASTP